MTDLITAAMVAGSLSMPPQKFTHEPTVAYRVEMVDPDYLVEVCGQRRDTIVLGCYVAWWKRTIFLRNDMTEDAKRLVLRHEIGHVNGWEHPR